MENVPNGTWAGRPKRQGIRAKKTISEDGGHSTASWTRCRRTILAICHSHPCQRRNDELWSRPRRLRFWMPDWRYSGTPACPCRGRPRAREGLSTSCPPPAAQCSRTDLCRQHRTRSHRRSPSPPGPSGSVTRSDRRVNRWHGRRGKQACLV